MCILRSFQLNNDPPYRKVTQRIYVSWHQGTCYQLTRNYEQVSLPGDACLYRVIDRPSCDKPDVEEIVIGPPLHLHTSTGTHDHIK